MIGRSVQYGAFGDDVDRSLEDAYGIVSALNRADTIKKMSKFGIPPSNDSGRSSANIRNFVDQLTPVVSRFAGDLFSRGRDSGLNAFNTYATGSASSSPVLVPGIGNVYKGAFD